MRWFPALFLLLGWANMTMGDDEYPRAGLLMEPKELAAAAGKVVILDARPQPNYAELHIQGARCADHQEWSAAFGEGDDPAGWSRRIGALGIDADTPVVVYDENRQKDAARIWWILRYWGVKDVRLLNGGWQAWFAARPGFGSGTPVPPQAKDFQAQPVAEKLATKAELLRSLDSQSLQIVDARSEAEHCGLEPLKNKRAGAIPGAKLLEWDDLLQEGSGRFKPAAELKQLFADAGIDLNKPTATHCQGGGRAAVMAFGMELMGAEQVSNYYKSWGEWGNDDDTPIEVPPRPASDNRAQP